MSSVIDTSYEPCYYVVMIKHSKIRVTFVTTKDNKAALEAIAEKQRRTLSSQIDYIIEQWLESQAVSAAPSD